MASNPAGDVLTYVLPVAIFLCVLLWGYFQRRGH